MTPSSYTEDTLVQQTTAEYLENELGWKSVYAYNTEDFGPDSLLGRSSEQEAVLKRPLREKLKELNPDLPGEAYEDAVHQIVTTTASQYGTLALNMRNALPNAGYIGFTGTPLFKDDEITRRVFGEYVSTYDFQRAVEDKATVPLYYDARGDKLGVSIGDLNERIAQKLEELETEDIDVEQRLEQELKRDYHIITAEKRLDQVARDFVRHYATSWETGKAMQAVKRVLVMKRQ